MLQIGPSRQSEKHDLDPCPYRQSAHYVNRQYDRIWKTQFYRSTQRQKDFIIKHFQKIDIPSSNLEDVASSDIDSDSGNHNEVGDEGDIDLVKQYKVKVRDSTKSYNKLLAQVRRKKRKGDATTKKESKSKRPKCQDVSDQKYKLDASHSSPDSAHDPSIPPNKNDPILSESLE